MSESKKILVIIGVVIFSVLGLCGYALKNISYYWCCDIFCIRIMWICFS